MIRDQLLKNGYVVIPKLVREDLCQEVIKDIDSHMIGSLSRLGGMVEMYHYQSMWNIRQDPLVYETFKSLFQTEKLWVSIDRTNYKNTVLQKDYPNNWGFIHWDENPNQKPKPFLLQGLVALTDTTQEMGGFQCLSSLFKKLDEWLESLPRKKVSNPNFTIYEDSAIHMEDYRGLWKVEKVPINAGDLLVWHSFLPHGNGVNRGTNPRYAMYITMFPIGDERLREERVNCWKNNETPSGFAFPGDVRRIEQKKAPAKLTKLGKKLLGIST